LERIHAANEIVSSAQLTDQRRAPVIASRLPGKVVVAWFNLLEEHVEVANIFAIREKRFGTLKDDYVRPKGLGYLFRALPC